MAKGFIYLCVVIDWYTRFILGWRLSNTLLAEFCVDALVDSFQQWGQPLIFNTDQGSQFTSDAFTSLLLKAEVRVSMDGKGRALDNIFVKRLWRTVNFEAIYLKAHADGWQLEAGLQAYFEFYNCRRFHQALAYQTPEQVLKRRKGSLNQVESKNN
ncbi:MAG: DDE-type integrase/transposase/recombinase [Bacteroidetes bacterium]|nr:DDE-type integrase/transposase/recombinase [Fibrella sp.]